MQEPARRSAVNELLETALGNLPPPPNPPAARQFPWLIVAGAALGLAVFAGAVALVISGLREEPALTLQIAAENNEAPQPSPARKPELPNWLPDLKIERQLGDRVGFGKWNWRIPKGFEPASAHLLPGATRSTRPLRSAGADSSIAAKIATSGR